MNPFDDVIEATRIYRTKLTRFDAELKRQKALWPAARGGTPAGDAAAAVISEDVAIGLYHVTRAAMDNPFAEALCDELRRLYAKAGEARPAALGGHGADGDLPELAELLETGHA